ncbi:MAG: hypothetical protein ACK4K4_02130 [Caldimicrobium sp.]
MSIQAFTHLFLVEGKDSKEAIEKVKNFLEKYQLVNYDNFTIDTKLISSAKEKNFEEDLEKALEENRKILRSYLSELKREGSLLTFEDIEKIPQGYLSKLFHTVAHLIDGFFGIDSYFYNLVEDSHGVSLPLRKKLLEEPDRYFLLKVIAHISEPVYYFEYLTPKKFFKR